VLPVRSLPVVLLASSKACSSRGDNAQAGMHANRPPLFRVRLSYSFQRHTAVVALAHGNALSC
jgi:hypothetical protein